MILRLVNSATSFFTDVVDHGALQSSSDHDPRDDCSDCGWACGRGMGEGAGDIGAFSDGVSDGCTGCKASAPKGGDDSVLREGSGGPVVRRTCSASLLPVPLTLPLSPMDLPRSPLPSLPPSLLLTLSELPCGRGEGGTVGPLAVASVDSGASDSVIDGLGLTPRT